MFVRQMMYGSPNFAPAVRFKGVDWLAVYFTTFSVSRLCSMERGQANDDELERIW
jgi:hypothetical protein